MFNVETKQYCDKIQEIFVLNVNFSDFHRKTNMIYC